MQNRRTIVRMIILALLLYSLSAFGQARIELFKTAELLERLGQKQKELESERQALEFSLAHAWDAEQISRLARERLGLVMPGEILFYFTEDNY